MSDSQAYQQAIIREFTFLKALSNPVDAWNASLELEEGRGYLVPVCQLDATLPESISLLSRWRRDNEIAYPSVFTVTDSGTAKWLSHLLDKVPDRLLFWVVDKRGVKIGHLGFNSCLNAESLMEVDNVVRGEKGQEPGLMAAAMRRLLKWAHEILQPKGYCLRVFEDNEHAVAFYRKLSFELESKIPLRRIALEDGCRFEAIDSGHSDRVFLRMVYRPQPILEAPEKTILTAGPSISAREITYVRDAALNGWNHQWSGYLDRFEKTLAEKVGCRYAVATSSCTGALHLSLLACGIGPGDEVIVPEITWVATAAAVRYVGATPIFADIEEDSWCICAESVASLITSRTKAIMPVHLYGHPARVAPLKALALKHGLKIIEDAAPALGASFENQPCGSMGDIAAFSFQGAKLLVTGEGGMVTTNDEALYLRFKKIWDQGRRPGTFWIEELGWKYKMSNLQAAFGLGQLERVETLIASKRRIFARYQRNLQGLLGISLNQEAPGARSIYWMSSLRIMAGMPLSQQELIDHLKSKHIDSRPVFAPISQFPLWSRSQAPAPRAQSIGSSSVNLPSGGCLRDAEIDFISEQIRSLIQERL